MKPLLEKVALTKLVKEIAKGRVSTPLTTLVERGVLRDEKTYTAGMHLGNSNISKSQHTEVLNHQIPSISTLRAGGAETSISPSGKTTIHYSSNALDGMKGNAATPGIIRHELFEAKTLQDQFFSKDKWGHFANRPKFIKDALTTHAMKGVNSESLLRAKVNYLNSMKGKLHPTPTIFKTTEGTVTSHASPEVLARESEMVRKNPYLAVIKGDRSRTGEDLLIKRITGKRYAADKMTGSDFRKARTAYPDNVETFNFAQHNVFDTRK